MAFNNTEQIIVDFFIASYGRVPTQSGLDYFRTQIDNNIMSEDDVIKYMMNNEEAINRYSSIDTLDAKINIVFYNVLGRHVASEEGMIFWKSKFNNDYTMANLVKDVIDIAKNTESSSIDTQVLINKSTVAEYFLKHVPSENQNGKQIYLDSVTAVNSSVKAIEDQIDNLTVVNTSKSYINHGLGDLSDSHTEGVSSLDSNAHWNKKELTFSFNQVIPKSYQEYPNDALTNNWSALNKSQENTVREIVGDINNLLDIKLIESKDNGDIRFNIVDMEQDTAGFSFYPADNPNYGGDVFLSSAFNNDHQNYKLDKGSGGWVTITHELGHALGLKHPFTEPNKLPSSQDDINHTVMSYTNKEDIAPNFEINGLTIKLDYQILYPDLYSLYDVSALQSIYGVNKTYHTEDNTYSVKYTDYQIQTIWDAGGADIIDLSDTKGDTTLDMKGGTLNSVDEYSLNDIIQLHQEGVTQSAFKDWIKERITEIYNENLLYTGKNNFGIAEGVIIEDIKTGSGDDTIKDNKVDNHIFTGEGNDNIYIGAGGYDHIDGGEGNDTLYLNILKNQVEIKEINTETYNIIADNFGAEIIGIEKIYFSNGDVYDL